MCQITHTDIFEIKIQQHRFFAHGIGFFALHKILQTGIYGKRPIAQGTTNKIGLNPFAAIGRNGKRPQRLCALPRHAAEISGDIKMRVTLNQCNNAGSFCFPEIMLQFQNINLDGISNKIISAIQSGT